MPFDEIFFPKLFNKATNRAPPETINSLWMLGFEDHLQRTTKPAPHHGADHDNDMPEAVVALDTTSTATPSKKKKKENKLKFISIYSKKPI